MLYMAKGKYQTRIAESQADIEATQQLRYRAFGLSHQSGIDCDAFDEHCHHFLIEDRKSGALVCCFRIMHLNGGAEIGQSYSAQYYELSSLNDFTGNLVELGAFASTRRSKTWTSFASLGGPLRNMWMRRGLTSFWLHLFSGDRCQHLLRCLCRAQGTNIWRPNAGCHGSRHPRCSNMQTACGANPI